MAAVLKLDQIQYPNGTVVPMVRNVWTARSNAYGSVALGANATYDWVTQTVTRSSTTSKLLISFNGQWSQNTASDSGCRLNSSLDGYLGTGADTSRNYLGIWSSGTDSNPWGSAYAMRPVAFSYLYTPSNTTATITIKIQIWVEAAITVYYNGDGWRGGGQQAHSVEAQLIIMELDG